MSLRDSSQLMPRSLVVVFIYFFMFHTSEAGRIVEHTTDGTLKIDLMNDYGVSITGFNKLVFDLKTCSNAVFVLSDKTTFETKHSQYFMVMLGAAKFKRLNGIKDSCFKCATFNVIAMKSTVSCDHFKSYFVRWDNKGSIKIGTGTDANNLKKVFLEYKSPNSFNLNFLSVLSLKSKATWRFRVDAKTLEKDTKEAKGSCEKGIKELKKKAEEEALKAKETLKKETEKIKEQTRDGVQKLVKQIKEYLKVKTDELLTQLDNVRI